AAIGPISHLLEMPNKLSLDGGLWLVTQLFLYKGWAWLFGPFHGLAMTCCKLYSALRPLNVASLPATIPPPLAYATLIGVFLAEGAALDVEIGQWDPVPLPRAWPIVRLRWEVAQAVIAILSLLGAGALLHAWQLDHAR